MHGKILTVKVLDGKHVGTTFTGSTKELWGVNFGEASVLQVLSEEPTDAMLHTENSVICNRLLTVH